ncbi:hypothetical protein CHL78_005155 [Romboutsia weinsteinii]|uniref:Uncharacterized protein n=1 Tax=Romboutsia weinsteinii TaxID=2020949 RepID=A0A371J7D4_9FIRM|nr:hypothetical protein [Romboutsia weinsteinii]RDY28577.1 hypothetical protein CHL78_005155 [Romboutsia weinsteinii]
MINGIIKLFYSEVVKTKMKSMSSGGYDLRNGGKEIRNITLKIDSLFFKVLKLFIGFSLLIIAFNINIILGIGTFLVEFTYLIYKKNLESEIKEKIDDIKNNIEITTDNFVSESDKTKINALISLLIIGILTRFNVIIIVSFIVVFIFTIKDIYSNIK